MTMLPKKIAAINDLAGYGRCSLSVMLPVISVTGNQCCAVPTAILSSTDAIENFFHYDLTNQMESYTQQWKKMNLAFDGIYTGYLNSRKQIDSILDFIQYFKKDNTILFVDPVLGIM